MISEHLLLFINDDINNYGQKNANILIVDNSFNVTLYT